ncbi:MAG: hypothetical protein Q9170_006330 [Blastenia crenularia]
MPEPKTSPHYFNLRDVLVQTTIPLNAAATSSQVTRTTSAAAGATTPPSPTPSTSSSKGGNKTNIGLAAGLGVTLGILAVSAAILVGLRIYRKSRQRSEKAQMVTEEVPSTNRISLVYPAEMNGYTAWEVAADKNIQEAPANPAPQAMRNRPELSESGSSFVRS